MVNTTSVAARDVNKTGVSLLTEVGSSCSSQRAHDIPVTAVSRPIGWKSPILTYPFYSNFAEIFASENLRVSEPSYGIVFVILLLAAHFGRI